jgi:uncharacterized protein (TIGR00304 family)
MDQNLVTAGLLLVLVGLVVGVIGLFRPSRTHTGSRGERRRGGGVVIIGFIPIVFGSDPKTTKVLLILSIILVVVLIGLFLLGVLV